ncbi:PREDICTED: beta-defensin 125 [Chrysochloris asiatica]|uniref:Beta-defensin n=1 Tax=Chrysochloris asiatica TaxID=185453 RepID=A0A9B0WLA1_CHRAS|nr:PREDICTED: beta-defensin 125 [Chrysochloris asiatica]
MNPLMLAFTICGSLALMAKAGWETQRCWKDDVGHCRKRCFKNERYKLLCKNKVTCCIPISAHIFTTKPPNRGIDIEERTTTTKVYSIPTIDDFITFKLFHTVKKISSKTHSSECTVNIG